MRLPGASPRAAVAGEEPLAGRSNYFLGANQAQWLRDIPHFERVRVRSAWPGIDVLYYTTAERHYEFDFVVTPNADPDRIELAFEDAEQVGIDGEGNLCISVEGQLFQWKKPVAYQKLDGKRVEVAANYYRPDGAPDRIRISLGGYDRSAELVIDPVIAYSAFLGADGGSFPAAVATTAAGEVVVAGVTFSLNFPMRHGIPGAGRDGFSADVFVTRLNASGSGVVFSTFLGGSGDDDANDLVLDASGNIHVVGSTYSPDFPVTPGARQSRLGGHSAGFATKLSAAGNSLTYSTYLFGSDFTEARGVALDPSGYAYVAGKVTDARTPAAPGGFQAQPGGSADGFLIKLHPVSGSGIFESYWGTTSADWLSDVTVNAAGEAYVAGFTCTNHAAAPLSTSNTPPVLRPVKSGSCESVVTKITTDGAARVWATYFGAPGGSTEIRKIALDGGGNVYIAGVTDSPSLATTAGAPGPVKAPGIAADAFVAKVSASGTALLYATYLGGEGPDELRDLAVVNNRATVAGVTSSPGYPVVNPAMTPSIAPSYMYSSTGGVIWALPSSLQSPGPISAIAIDPVNPGRLYAAVAGADYILRSTDGGVTWTPRPTPGETAHAVAIAASNPTVVYLATTRGVLRSTDAGQTWTSAATGLFGGALLIAVSPENPNLAYVYTGASVYRTTTGGASWIESVTNLPVYDITSLAFDPATPSRVYAATRRGLYIGNANSDSWGWGGLTNQEVRALALDNFGTLYAVSGSNILWVSRNGGASFTRVAEREFQAEITAIAVEPGDGQVIHVSETGRGVRKSIDGGTMFGTATLGNLHAGVLAVGTDNRIHVGVAGQQGVFVSQLNEAGTALTFSSHFVGAAGGALAADASGDLYVAGTAGAGFPAASLNGSLGGGLVFKLGMTNPPCYATASVAHALFPAEGGATAVGVAAPSGCSWSALASSDWIVLHRDVSATTGSGSFHVTVKGNPGLFPRVGYIHFFSSGGSSILTIHQTDASSCSYAVSSNVPTFAPAGGNGTLQIVTAAGCPWSLSSPVSWISLNVTGGSGSGTINANVAPNPAETARSAVLDFGTVRYIVHQAGACATAISPAEVVISPLGGTATVQIHSPAGCRWSFMPSPPFRVSPEWGTGSRTVEITAPPNHDASARFGSVAVLDPRVPPVRVVQSPATCTYSLSTQTAALSPSTGGALRVDLATGPGCAWHAESLASWIRLDGADSLNGRTGTGPGALNMLVLGNPERQARNGVVRIAGREVTVPQAAGSPVLANTAFVQNLYYDLLGRTPEAGGLSYWVGLLENRAQTREQVAGAYFNAPEFGDTAQFVINLYLGLLARDPDFAGWNQRLGQMRGGLSRAAIVSAFMATPEVAAIWDPLSPRDFVNTLYQNLLGRAAAPAEIDYWLGTGLPRPAVALQFLESAEFRSRFRRRALANACYLGFLRRRGEPAGLDYWESFQAFGTLAELVAGFVNSAEYLNRPFTAR